MSIALTIAAFAAAGALLVAAVVLIIVGVKLSKTADAVNKVVATAEAELLPLLQESRSTLENITAIAAGVKEKADRADRLINIVENLVSGVAVATAASKAMRTSSVAATGILEGLRIGLKMLRGAPKENKEVSGDE